MQRLTHNNAPCEEFLCLPENNPSHYDSAETKQRTITMNQYLQLVGLHTLAEGFNRSLKDIEVAAAMLLAEPDDGSGYYGLVSDMVYGSHTPDELIRDLEIKVENFVA